MGDHTGSQVDQVPNNKYIEGAATHIYIHRAEDLLKLVREGAQGLVVAVVDAGVGGAVGGGSFVAASWAVHSRIDCSKGCMF